MADKEKKTKTFYVRRVDNGIIFHNETKENVLVYNKNSEFTKMVGKFFVPAEEDKGMEFRITVTID